MSNPRKRLVADDVQRQDTRDSSISDPNVSDEEYDFDGSNTFGTAHDESALPEEFGGQSRARKKRMRPSSEPLLDVKAETAAWEKHTKGVGSRLLKKMGFSGRLGLREDGIAAPVTAKLRPDKLGLGVKGFSEKTLQEITMDEVRVRNQITKSRDADIQFDVSGRDGKQNRPVQRWREVPSIQADWKTSTARSTGQRTRLRLVDLTRGNSSHSEELKLEPSDSTETANALCAHVSNLVLQDHDAVAPEEQGVFDVPELIFNVQVLVDTAKVDLDHASQRLSNEKLLKSSAASEMKRLEGSHVSDFKLLKSLEELRRQMENLITASSLRGNAGIVVADCPKKDTRDLLDALVILARSAVFHEAIMKEPGDPFGLRKALLAVVEQQFVRLFPICANRILGGDSETMKSAPCHTEFDSTGEMITVNDACGLLLDSLHVAVNLLGNDKSDDLNMRLLCRCILTPLSRILSIQWNPENPDRLISFWESLHSIIPASLRTVFLEDVIVSRLQRHVEQWSYDREIAGFHVWIFPWLPITGKEMLSPVFGCCRHKLATLARAWKNAVERATGFDKYSDIHKLFIPWKSVLSKSKFQAILTRYIVPALGLSLDRHLTTFSPDIGGHVDVVFSEGKDFCTFGNDCRHVDGRCSNLAEVLAWGDVVGTNLLRSVLLTSFFPHLCRSLQGFLFHPLSSAEQGDINAVSERSSLAAKWYSNWKKTLSASLNFSLRSGFAALLFLLHAASLVKSSSSREILYNAEAQLLLINSYSLQDQNSQSSMLQGDNSDNDISSTEKHDQLQKLRAKNSNILPGQRATFKETVRTIAETNGFSFVPSDEKTEDGQVIFLFGKIRVYLDGTRQILLADIDNKGSKGEFLPVSMTDLVQEASVKLPASR